MINTDTIETVIELPHSQQKVWDAITTPAGLNQWFGDRVTMELKEGAPIYFEWDKFGDASGRIEVVDPISTFVYRWRAHGIAENIEMTASNSTLVTFKLILKGQDQTELHVIETGFANLPPKLREVAHRENSQGWRVELGELAELLGGKIV